MTTGRSFVGELYLYNEFYAQQNNLVWNRHQASLRLNHLQSHIHQTLRDFLTWKHDNSKSLVNPCGSNTNQNFHLWDPWPSIHLSEDFHSNSSQTDPSVSTWFLDDFFSFMHIWRIDLKGQEQIANYSSHCFHLRSVRNVLQQKTMDKESPPQSLTCEAPRELAMPNSITSTTSSLMPTSDIQETKEHTIQPFWHNSNIWKT